MAKAKFIAVEGTDGSGKQTLCEGLKEKAFREGIPLQLISFPRYDTPTGKSVRAYLKGEYGNPINLNPKLCSTLYAADRAAAISQMNLLLNNGITILADRFIGSNLAHQGAKLPPEQREEFVKWCEDYEYNGLRIPKPDFTFCLNLPPDQTRQAIENRQLDGHEADRGYQQKVVDTYLWLAQREDWGLVDCIKKDNPTRKTPEELADEIWPTIRSVINPQTQ